MPTRGAGLLDLPTVDTTGWNACGGVGLVNAKLAGDENDPRHAWLIANGRRVDVVFPRNLGVRFTPQLEIVDENGGVVARGGDAVDGGCVTGTTDGAPLLILWP